MKIALVSHYYPPEVNAPAQRAIAHANVWRDMGHDVTIITAQPSHPYGEIYDGYLNKNTIKTENGVKIIRLKTRLGANAGTIGRSLNYLSFMMSVWKNRKKNGDLDIVISTSPQFFCGYAGRFIAKYARVPWVLEIRDVWPDSIIAVGAAKPSLATQVLSKWVDYAYRKCTHIVSVSQGFNDHFKSRDVPDDKVSLIQNGIISDVKPIKSHVDDFPELSPIAGRFIVSYIGTLGMAHNVGTMLEAAEMLKGRQDIGFLIVGSGANRDHLLQVIKEKDMQNVVLMDQRPHEIIKKLFSLSSACLVILKKQDVFKTVIPTKLLEGMAMSKPILLGVEGTAKDILVSANAGIPFEPENAKELADAIGKLAGDEKQAAKFGNAGRAYIHKYFDRTKMAEKYIALMERLIIENKVKGQ